jgi:hypothetical protein
MFREFVSSQNFLYLLKISGKKPARFSKPGRFNQVYPDFVEKIRVFFPKQSIKTYKYLNCELFNPL